jgi:8-oxo-dGTP diphosphatase
LPEAVVGVLEREDRFLMVKRAPSARNPGRWGLPSGKIEPGETEPEAVVREMREELAVEVVPVRRLWTSTSADGAWTTHWWEANVEQGRVSPARREVDDARWLTIAEVRRLGCVFPTDLQFFGTVWPTTAEVVLAEPGDIDAVLHLRDEAAAWMVDRGLNQWAPGDFPREFVQVRVDSGQVFVMRRRGRALATVTITWSDELVWGEPSSQAGYVHMLVVSSALRGSSGSSQRRWCSRPSCTDWPRPSASDYPPLRITSGRSRWSPSFRSSWLARFSRSPHCPTGLRQ